jgi:hypothetical protein
VKTIMIDVPAGVVGIYHLMRGKQVRYIGQTTNVFSRIGTWKTRHFQPDAFDRVAFYPCSVTALDALECEHITQYRPELNSEGVRKPYRTRPWVRAAQMQAVSDEKTPDRTNLPTTP